VTLPVWRGKISAAIASAQARHDAAAARLRAEELMVAAELARMTSMVREADRMVRYIDQTALPNLRQSFDTLAAAYETGMAGFAMIPETQEMVLAMQVERVAALRDREKTLADLSLLVAGNVPAGAPLPSGSVALAHANP
jgi:outer membrane protein TolC